MLDILDLSILPYSVTVKLPYSYTYLSVVDITPELTRSLSAIVCYIVVFVVTTALHCGIFMLP